jgi:DNA-binding beta-propeller fold protein YncE
VREPDLVFGRPGPHDGQFQMPREVGFSPDGRRLYVLDRSHRVQVFAAADGGHIDTWPTPVGTNGNPRGLDVAPNGDVYVADTHNSQILVFSADGKLRRKWGHRGTGPGEFIAVTDVALDSKGNAWTCEYGGYSDRIQKFDPRGRHLLTVGTFGSGAGQFSRPQGIAVDRKDRVYVADAVNHRIQVLAPDGKVERVWGEVGSAPGQLRYPYSVSFDPSGRLYVAEYGNSRVSVFTPDGTFITSFGQPGHRQAEFDHPWGAHVSPAGQVYVSDTMNYRVKRFPALPGERLVHERR